MRIPRGMGELGPAGSDTEELVVCGRDGGREDVGVAKGSYETLGVEDGDGAALDGVDIEAIGTAVDIQITNAMAVIYDLLLNQSMS